MSSGMISRVGAPRAATVTYLIPLFGVIWAWIVLGEPLTLTMAIAGALILGGVALSQQRKERTNTAELGFSPSRCFREDTVMKTIVMSTCATLLLFAALAPQAA